MERRTQSPRRIWVSGAWIALLLGAVSGCADTTFAAPTSKHEFSPGKAGPSEARAFRDSYTTFVERTTTDLKIGADASANDVYGPAGFYQACVALLNASDGATFENLSKLTSNPSPDAFAVSQGFGEWLAGLVTESPVAVKSSVWCVRPYLVKPSYTQDMARYYGVDALKLGTAGLAGERALKEWINLDRGLVPEGAVPQLNKDMDLLLLTTTTVDGTWQSPFAPVAGDQPGFKTSAGVVAAKFMSANLVGAMVSQSPETTAVQVPLEDPRFALVLVMPTDGAPCDGKTALSNLDWTKADVALTLPKFRATSVRSLEGAVGRLGSPDLLAHANDFQRISTDLDAGAVSIVRQVIDLTVGETGIGQTGRGKPARATKAGPGSTTLVFERPFAFQLLHVPSNQPVLIGVVNNPVPGD